MRKLYFLLFAVFFQLMAFSQQVAIGTGTATNSNSPWNAFYGYSYVQTVYLGSEISASGNITSVQFYYAGASLSSSDSIDLYMGVTSKNSFASTTDWEPLTNLTPVFSGLLTGYTVPGWITITLTTPFPYDASLGNLIIAADENKDGFDGSTRFQGTTIGTNRILAYSNDNTNPDPATPPTGTRSSIVGNILIDGLVTSNCKSISGLTVTGITQTGANASWLAPTSGNVPTQYNYEVRTSGAAGSGSTGLAASGNSATINKALTGLNPGISYTLYVRADCGSGSTGPWSSVSFSTVCGTVTTFTENFDASANLPVCWNKVGTGGLANIQTTNPNSSPNTLYIYSGSASSRAVVSMPPVSNASAGNYQLKFSARANFTIGDTLQVGYLTNPTDSSTFVLIQEFAMSTLTYQTYTVTPSGLTGSSVVFAFRNKGSLGYSILIDDVSWQPLPSCTQPNTLVVSSIAATTAQLGWTAPATAPVSYDVYYSTSNATPVSTTTPSATGVIPTSYSLTGLSVGTKYFVWVRSVCGANGVSLWSGVDSFTTTVLCNAPTTLIVSNITATAAKLDWTAPSSAPASYDVYYSTSNAAPVATTTPSATGVAATTYNLAALSGATHYFVWVRSNCGAGGKSIWSVADSFYTTCGTTGIPYTQNFESAVIPGLPVCTSAENLSTGTGNIWKTVSAPGNGFTNNALEYPWNGSSPANTWFYTQGLNLTAGSTYQLAFKYGNNSATFVESMNVSYGTSASAASMTNLLVDYPSITGGVPSNAATNFTPLVTGVYYIGFHAYSATNQFNLYVDDISVTTAPTCTAPVAVSVSNITTSSAKLNWTAPATPPASYDVYYNTSGIQPVASTTPSATGVTTTNYILTPLSANTKYFAWVRSNCGTSVYSQWTVKDSFTTAPATCDTSTAVVVSNITTTTATVSWTPPASAPLSYDVYYSTSATAPTSTTTPSATGIVSTTYNLTGLSAGTTYYVWIRSVCSAGLNSAWASRISFTTLTATCDAPTAVTESNITTTTANIGWTAPVPAPLSYDVYYSTSTTAPTSTTTPSIAGITPTNTILTGLTSGTAYYVWVRSVCSAGLNSVWTSSINFTTLTATCDTVPSAVVSNITTTTAILDWTAPASAPVSYDVYYSTSATVPTSSTTPSSSGITSTSYILTGLTSGTTYYVWIRSNCGSTNSAWASRISFTTLTAACDTPTVVMVSNITTTTASVSWTAPATAPTGYDVYYSTSATAPTSTTTPTVSVTTTTASLTGLTAGTTYYLWVRSNCGSGVYSTWTKVTFTTAPNTGCSPVSDFAETFDAVTTPALPTCWVKVGTGGLARTQTSATPTPPSSPYVMYIYGTSATSQAVVSMPAVNNVDSNTHQIKFSARGNFTAGATIQVGYLTNPTDSSSFVSFQDIVTTSTTAWTSYTVIPTGVSGSSVVFAFRHTGTPAYSVLIDNVSWAPIPSCVEPNTLVISNITTSSADLDWTPPSVSTPASYDVYYSISNVAPTSATFPSAAGIAGTTYNLTGLSSSTYYYVWVRSNCGTGGYSVWSVVDSFITACVGIPAFSENFDGVTTPRLPNCWSKILRGATLPAAASVNTATGNAYSAPNAVAMYNSTATSSDDIILVSPPVSNLSAGTYQLSFYAKNSVLGQDIEIGTLDDNSATANFTSLQTVTVTTSYQKFVVSFAGYSGSDTYIGIRRINANTFSYVYVDNVKWELIPSCSEPTTLLVSNITTTTATLDWAPPATSTPASYDVYYSTSNVAPTGTTPPSASSILLTTYNFASLSPSTQYFVWVRSNCGAGGYSVWSAADSFYTLCDAVNVPYTQDFESAVIPALPPCTAAENLTTATGNIWKTVAAPGSGFISKTLEYPWNGASAADTWFYTQGINMTAGTSYRLKFNYGNNSTTYHESLNVNYGTSPVSSSMNDLIVDYPSFTGGVPVASSTDFTPATTGVYYIGFHAYSIANQFNLFVDDISVDVTPSCSEPTGVTASSITANGAQIDWTPPTAGSPSSYDVYYSSSNVAPTSTTTPSATLIASPPYNLTGLSSATYYYVWVRSDCGAGGKSVWSVVDSFITACVGIPAFSENFDGVTTPRLPNCWSKILRGATLPAAASVNTATGNAYSAPNAVAMYNSTATSSDDIILVSPPVSNLSAGTYQLSFYAKNSVLGQDIEIGTLDDNSATANFTSLQTVTVTTSYQKFVVSFAGYSGSDTYIGIRRINANTFSYVYVDNVKWELIPSCSEPTTLLVSNITTTTATLDWAPPATSTPASYDVYYSTSNVAPTGTTPPSASSILLTTYNFASLSPSTQYFVWVRSNCGAGGYSVWSAADSFYTLCDAVNVPYTQDFESAVIPALPPCTAAENLTTATGNIWKTVAAPGSGFISKTLEYPWNGASAADTWFYTQGINMTAGTSYRLKFNYGNNSTTYHESLNVNYGTSPVSSSMNDLIVDYPSFTGGVPVASSTDFTPATTGVYYIGFHAYSIANQFNLFVDDISVDVTPSCSEPTALVVTNINLTDAQIDWTAPATPPASYDVYYSISNVAPTASTPPSVSGVSSTTTVLTGLSASTTYYVWVRSNCGAGGYSAWSSIVSFATLCGVITAPTLAPEQFVSAIPACWSRAQGILSNPTTFTSTTTSGWTLDDFGNVPTPINKSAKLNIYGTTRKEWLMTPSYDLGSTDHFKLEFDLAFTTWNLTTPNVLGPDDKFAVVISTDNGVTWSDANVLRMWDASTPISATGEHIVINLAAYTGVVMLGFYGESTITGNGDNDVFVDNVEIKLAVMPVTLVSFKGDRQGSRNMLTWKTATEQNNKGYELQRSSNGQSFSTIGFIQSKAVNGNSTSGLNYNYADEKPLNGNNYYRLKQLDFDGKPTLSNIVLIKGVRVDAIVLSSIYPNPAKTLLNVVLTAPANDRVSMIVTDLAGKIVMEKTTQLVSGDNNLVMNVAGLPSGTYMIKAVCNNGCETAISKFVKQ